MPRGRRTKLTPTLQRKVCAALRKGATRKAACGVVGIHPATFSKWMQNGRQAETGIQREFHDAVVAAESAGEQSYVSVLDQVAKNGDKDADRVRAACFLLERRYGWSQRTEVTGKDGAPVRVEARTEVTERRALFSDEQLEALTPEMLQAAIAARYGTAAEAK